jgi:hypothetical protein
MTQDEQEKSGIAAPDYDIDGWRDEDDVLVEDPMFVLLA